MCYFKQLVIVALALAAGACWSQGVTPERSAAARAASAQTTTQKSIPLSPEERARIETTVLADQRVKRIVGPEKPRVLVSEAHVDKGEAEAYISGASEKPPTHTVNIVVFNPKTNQAVHTLMHLEEHRILEVRDITAEDVPFVGEDASEALTLAKANADVRRAVGPQLDQFVLREPGSNARVPYAAEALPVRSTDPGDPCTTGRCLELIFRTEAGYLPVRAAVDLTKKTVKVITHQSEGGRH